MFVHVDITVAFQLFCIVQGLTTAAYLLAHPRPAGNRWLGLLLDLTLQVVDYFLSRSGVYYRHRELYFTPLFFSWSFGPLLWGYVCSRYGPVQLRWPHFVPVAVQVLFYTVVALQSFDTKTWFWLAVHKPMTRYIEHYGAVASVLGYGAMALRRLARHGQQPRWLWRGLLLVGGFYLAAALDPLVKAAYLPPGAPKFYLTSLVLPLLAYALALLTWRDARGTELATTLAAALAPMPPCASEPAPPTAPDPLPSIAAPAPSIDAGQLARVTRALETEELYKNPALTLDDLARHLGLSSNAVSYLLNAGFTTR
jgi:hypothetical protein